MTTEGAAAAPHRRHRLLRGAAPIAAVAAIVAGGVLIGVGEWQSAHESYGWFAYAPLSDTTFTPTPAWNATPVGVALVAAGFAGLAFVAGWRSAARRSRILRPVPWIVGGAAATAAGVALEVWRQTHLLFGWHDFGPRAAGRSVVMTKEQLIALLAPHPLPPAVVAAALIVVGVAALALAAGRLGATVRGSRRGRQPETHTP
ncbi:hypothetical protein [Frondihabitans australicus]|uniref:DUF2567 domain-containing protein n=1 Tax=Frondihabitans australicus TaxID=386892 RepID=A0A495IF91_9MICO|nr:hypothetical protein [Frondihabitans australicus]RKR74672.1 hypothetical protein C8E83_1799 [Frondihabitans australicus]